MPLQVIGAGLPRTGTASLKTALEQLGFGPCYHMSEVLAHPEHWALWLEAFDGGPARWDEV
jgi:Sulfotransferase domain